VKKIRNKETQPRKGLRRSVAALLTAGAVLAPAGTAVAGGDTLPRPNGIWEQSINDVPGAWKTYNKKNRDDVKSEKINQDDLVPVQKAVLSHLGLDGRHELTDMSSFVVRDQSQSQQHASLDGGGLFIVGIAGADIHGKQDSSSSGTTVESVKFAWKTNGPKDQAITLSEVPVSNVEYKITSDPDAKPNVDFKFNYDQMFRTDVGANDGVDEPHSWKADRLDDKPSFSEKVTENRNWYLKSAPVVVFTVNQKQYNAIQTQYAEVDSAKR